MSNIYYVVFKNEDGKFPVLEDPGVDKKYIAYKMCNSKMLILGFAHHKQDEVDKLKAYVQLKYAGEAMPLSSMIVDRSPIPNVDYVPIKKTSKLKIKTL